MCDVSMPVKKQIHLDPDDMLILILHASTDNNRIDGRTTIQKIGYFVSSRLGIDNGYFPHYFGPYSPIIASNLQNLVSLGLVAEDAVLTQNERKMYSYSLTEDGKTYANSIIPKLKRQFKIVKNVVDRAQVISGNRINRLSAAAKVHYLASHSDTALTLSSAIEMAKSLGWNLEENQIISGAKTLRKMRPSRRTSS